MLKIDKEISERNITTPEDLEFPDQFGNTIRFDKPRGIIDGKTSRRGLLKDAFIVINSYPRGGGK